VICTIESRSLRHELLLLLLLPRKQKLALSAQNQFYPTSHYFTVKVSLLFVPLEIDFEAVENVCAIRNCVFAL